MTPILRIAIGFGFVILSIIIILDAIKDFRNPEKDKVWFWKWGAVPTGIIGIFVGLIFIFVAMWELL